MYGSHREREREAETQAEGETGSMHREPDVGFDPRSPGSRPGPKAGAKPLRHPGIPKLEVLTTRFNDVEERGSDIEDKLMAKRETEEKKQTIKIP